MVASKALVVVRASRNCFPGFVAHSLVYSLLCSLYSNALVSGQSRDMDKLSRSSSSSSQHAMLEAKINQRDSAADDLTQRNNFSLFCIWEESKLVKVRGRESLFFAGTSARGESFAVSSPFQLCSFCGLFISGQLCTDRFAHARARLVANHQPSAGEIAWKAVVWILFTLAVRSSYSSFFAGPIIQLAGAWEQVLPVTDKLVAELDAEDVFS